MQRLVDAALVGTKRSTALQHKHYLSRQCRAGWLRDALPAFIGPRLGIHGFPLLTGHFAMASDRVLAISRGPLPCLADYES